MCRARPDGLNLYDKKCIREKITESRVRLREYKKRNGFVAVPRKQCQKARPIWRMKVSSQMKVKLAFDRGITDRNELRRVTKLGWDELCDTICLLADEGKIKWNRQEQRFKAA